MRIKRAVSAVKKRRKIMKLAKGYFGSKSRSYRIAREAVMKSGMYAFIGRRLRKRDFRKLWIARINAAACLTLNLCMALRPPVLNLTGRFLRILPSMMRLHLKLWQTRHLKPSQNN